MAKADRLPPPADPRRLLARISSTPQLASVVPRLPAEVLHGVIQVCGLEDSAELLALATAEQLSAVADLDLWRPDRPGGEERFDPVRFTAWLEALAELDAVRAAETVARMDPALVAAGLAPHIRVFDVAAAMPAWTEDSEAATDARGLVRELGGYRVVARRSDAWDAIVAVLVALADVNADGFHRVMRGCRQLSNAGFEIDGLDDLLAAGDQVVFDLAVDREDRREARGYVSPAQARAFLTASRELRLDTVAVPPQHPIVTAHHCEIERAHESSLTPQPDTVERPDPNSTDQADAGVAAMIDALVDAGALPERPRALLTGADSESPRFFRLVKHLQFLHERDPLAHSSGSQDLAFLANVLVAGCSLQGRPFAPREASEAVAAICNLGLEKWPEQWREQQPDLTIVFQVGLAVLHRDVVMRAAADLHDAIAAFNCSDRETQFGLHALQRALTIHLRTGTPWGARDSMEVLAILDTPTWAALLGLVAEFPVMLANVSAAGSARPLLSFDPSAFEFVADAAALECVRRFLARMPDALAR
jgi:hypothetical protein